MKPSPSLNDGSGRIPSEVFIPLAEDEEWRPLGDAPFYWISNCGRVASMVSGAKLLKLVPNAGTKRQYVQFSVGGRGNRKQHVLLHRAVLEAFVGPAPTSEHEGAHRDGDPLNNRLSNLTWKTPLENSRDKYEHGTVLFGRQNPAAKLNEDTVRSIRTRYANGETYVQISQDLGLNYNTVADTGRRRYWKHVA